MSRIHFVCVLLFLGSLHAPRVTAADEHDMEERSFKDKILALTKELIETFAKHELDKEMKMWHPDAYLSVEGSPVAHGMEAIANLTKILGNPIHDMKTEYVDVGPVEEGADYVYVLYNTKEYNQEAKLIGDIKCLLVWRNTEDGYKVAYLMVNSNE